MVIHVLQDYTKLFVLLMVALMLGSFQENHASAILSSQTVTGSVVIAKPVSSEVNGEGNLDDKTHFEFDIKPSKKGVDGHLEYTDNTYKIKLESDQIAFLSVVPPTAVFSGTGILNKQTITFLTSVTINHQLCHNDFFSIIIKDKSGLIIYQKTGYLESGDIEIANSDLDDKSAQKCTVEGSGTVGRDIKFNVDIVQKNSKSSGSLQYSDQNTKMTLSSTSITSFSETSANTSTILGVATVDAKKNYTFELFVVGNQKPPTKDILAIIIFDSTGKDTYSKIDHTTSGELIVK